CASWEANRPTCSCCSSSSGRGLTERHTEVREERAALGIRLRRRDDADVETLDRVDLVVLDLREDDLLANAHGEVATAVEATRRDATEVAHAGQRDVAEPIEELPHPLAAQRDHDADLLTLAELEDRDVLLRARHDGRLAGDGLELLDAVVDHLGLVLRLAETHVDRDLDEPRHLHRSLVTKLLHQGLTDLLVVRLLETRRLLALVGRRRTTRLGGLLPTTSLGLRLLGALFLLGLGGCFFVLVGHGSYIPAFGNSVPDFTPTRTFLSPLTTVLVRVPRFVLLSNSSTLEMWIVPSLSTIPPCGFFCVGRVWRFTIATFS